MDDCGNADEDGSTASEDRGKDGATDGATANVADDAEGCGPARGGNSVT